MSTSLNYIVTHTVFENIALPIFFSVYTIPAENRPIGLYMTSPMLWLHAGVLDAITSRFKQLEAVVEVLNYTE